MRGMCSVGIMVKRALMEKMKLYRSHQILFYWPYSAMLAGEVFDCVKESLCFGSGAQVVKLQRSC